MNLTLIPEIEVHMELVDGEPGSAGKEALRKTLLALSSGIEREPGIKPGSVQIDIKAIKYRVVRDD